MSTKLDQLKAVFERKTASNESTNDYPYDGWGWFEFDAKVKGVEKYQSTYVQLKLTKEVFESNHYGCRDITFIQRKGEAKLSFELHGDWERQALVDELKRLIKVLESPSE